MLAAPLRDFIHRRDALARELRARGALEEARALANLRKPPVGLWIANQLARLAPDEVKALVEATARIRQGQSAGARGASGEALRGAMRDQREALARLGDAAGKAAVEAGTKLTLELQRRVQNTVQAAAASEPAALREGSLERELLPAGFGELLDAPDGAEATPPPKAAPAPKKDSDHAGRSRKKEEAAAAHERQKQEAAARAGEKERARALREARQQADRLETVAKKLEGEADALQQEAAGARERADRARREATAAAARVVALGQ